MTVYYRVWHESGDLLIESSDPSEIEHAMRDAILGHLEDDPCRGCGVLTPPEHHGYSIQACRGDWDVTGDPTIELPRVQGAVAEWITTDTRTPADSAEVARDVADIERHRTGEISDASALAIASWWQSPGGVGRYFAQLASTGEVPADGLARDIRSTLADLERQGRRGTWDYRCLELLATWAINHPSREDAKRVNGRTLPGRWS